MSYSVNTSSILSFMGYGENYYTASNIDGNIVLDWYHTDPQPSEQDILDNELPWYKSVNKDKVKTQASIKGAETYTFIQPSPENILGLMDFASDIYTHIVPAAREALHSGLLTLKTISDITRAAITDINNASDISTVDTITNQAIADIGEI